MFLTNFFDAIYKDQFIVRSIQFDKNK